MDDENLQDPSVDPREMAAHDQAAADKYQELADAELALRDGLRLNARLLSTQGFDEAAEKARGSANLADTIEDHAESGNTVYLHAANAWTNVAEDQTDEARRADQATAEKFDEVGRKVDGWIAPYERQQKE